MLSTTVRLMLSTFSLGSVSCSQSTGVRTSSPNRILLGVNPWQHFSSFATVLPPRRRGHPKVFPVVAVLALEDSSSALDFCAPLVSLRMVGDVSHSPLPHFAFELVPDKLGTIVGDDCSSVSKPRKDSFQV